MGIPAFLLDLVALLGVGAAACVDLRERRIPNGLNAAIGLAGVVLPPLVGLPGRLAAAVLCGGVLAGARYAGQHVLGEPGVGWGDVKLAAALGLLLGWPAAWALYLGVALGAAWGVLGRVSNRLAARARLPLAPFILGGLALALYALPAATLWEWLVGPRL